MNFLVPSVLLNAAQTFLKILLDHSSSKLYTLRISWSSCNNLNLLHWISSLPEILEKFIQEDRNEVIAYFDDILVLGKDLKDHITNLKTEMDLNNQKLILLIFWGMQSACLESAQMSKFRSHTKNVESYKNKVELKRLLNMIPYVMKLFPNLFNEIIDLVRRYRILVMLETSIFTAYLVHTHDFLYTEAYSKSV